MKKRVLAILILILVVLTPTFSQDDLDNLRSSKKIEPVSGELAAPYFSIQVLALREPATNAFYFDHIEHAYEFSCSDGYTRYCVERFNTFKEAIERVAHYKELGYTQAFAVNTRNFNLNKGAKVVNTSDLDPNGTYTVQLKAFRIPVYLSYFKPIENIMEFYPKDKIYKYTVGSFNLEEGKKELEKYKKMGYDDASLVDLDAYMPYKIE